MMIVIPIIISDAGHDIVMLIMIIKMIMIMMPITMIMMPIMIIIMDLDLRQF